MKKDYLVQEIEEGIKELSPLGECLTNDFLVHLEEIEMICEHILSCVGALQKKRRLYE